MNLIQLARKTLEGYFQKQEFKPDENTIQKYNKKQSSFVTLTINNQLRGCIGSLTPTQPLYKDIMQNTLNAAFHDPRFPPLTKQELKQVKIEISILTQPTKIEFNTPEQLLNKINNKMGILLKKNFYSSTFLPQVWEHFPNKIQFLEALSQKAGLNKDIWQTADIFFYFVKIEKEN